MVTIQMGQEEIRIVGRTVLGHGPWYTLVRNDATMMTIGTEDPFPALTIAKKMVETYGAVILSQQPPATEPGLIY